MTQLLRGTASVLICSSLFFVIGCSKKVTKIEQPPTTVKETVAEPKEEKIFQAVETGPVLRDLLQPLYFEYDKYNLRPDAGHVDSGQQRISGLVARRIAHRVLFTSDRPVRYLLYTTRRHRIKTTDRHGQGENARLVAILTW